MDEMENPYIQHITEMKAREKYSDIQEMMDYIVAETRIREILWSLRDQEIQFAQDFSFLEFGLHEKEAPIYDFLVTKDNFDLMIFLNDKKENGRFSVSRQRLEAHRKALKYYPFVEGIADVWVKEREYPTKCFFLRDIELKLSNGNNFINVPSEEVSSFQIAVTDFFAKLIKKPPLVRFELQEKEHFDMIENFKRNLQNTFEKLKSTHPRLDFKSKAIDDLTEEHVSALTELFQMELEGKISLEETEGKIRKIALI